MSHYHFLILSQEDFLQNQVLEELFRERMTYLTNENKPIDFWIIMSPFYLEKDEIKNQIGLTQFFEQNTNFILKNKIYCAMILSTSIQYLYWLKLRLGYFENFHQEFVENSRKFQSDGLFGTLEKKEFQKLNPFFSKKPNLHPTIRLKKLNEIYID